MLTEISTQTTPSDYWIKGGKNLKISQVMREYMSLKYDRGYTIKRIALEYGVSVKQVTSILKGDVWGFEGNQNFKDKCDRHGGRGGNNRKIPIVDYDLIYQRFLAGESNRSIAEDYHCHKNSIGRRIKLIKAILLKEQIDRIEPSQMLNIEVD